MFFNLSIGVVLLLVLGLFIVVYFFFLNLEQQSVVNRLLKSYGWIILVIAIYIWVKDDWGTFEQDDWVTQKANFILLCVIGGIFYFKALMGHWRYKTPNKFMAYGLDGSFSAAPVKTENGFLIIVLDGIQAEFVNIWKGQRIAVIRQETAEYLKTSIISISHMKLVPKEKLPEEVLQRINNISYMSGIEEIYYGYFDPQKEEEFMEDALVELESQKEKQEYLNFIKQNFNVKNPTFGDLKLLLEIKDAAFNKLAEQFKAVTENNERFGGHIQRMGEVFRPREKQRPPLEGGDGD